MGRPKWSLQMRLTMMTRVPERFSASQDGFPVSGRPDVSWDAASWDGAREHPGTRSAHLPDAGPRPWTRIPSRTLRRCIPERPRRLGRSVFVLGRPSSWDAQTRPGRQSRLGRHQSSRTLKSSGTLSAVLSDTLSVSGRPKASRDVHRVPGHSRSVPGWQEFLGWQSGRPRTPTASRTVIVVLGHSARPGTIRAVLGRCSHPRTVMTRPRTVRTS